MFESFKETFGVNVAETVLEEFLSRDREIIALREDIASVRHGLDRLEENFEYRFAAVDSRIQSVDTRCDAIDKRLNSIENWIRVMVIGFLGFASTSMFMAYQLR